MIKLKNFETNYRIGINVRFFIAILTLVNLFLLLPSVSFAESGKVKSVSTVSLFLGKSRFSLFGYTSPHAQVSLSGMGIYYETVAAENGYFVFSEEFSPLSSREACLIAVDTQGRTSQAVCLPPFPIEKNVNIGPIILPPTVSVNQHSYVMNDSGILQGQTVPKADVHISFFEEDLSNKYNSNVSFPSLTAHSDNQGYFSLSFPTQKSNIYRSFASTKFENNLSSKSNTLTFDVLPLWRLILKMIFLLLDRISENILPFVIFTELLIFILFFLPIKRKKAKYPLALRPDHSLEGN